MNRIWKWLKRIVLALLGFIVLAAVTGAIWHSWAMRMTERKYPPPGEFIDVGECKLHYIVEGEGSPIVVIEPGAGEASLDYLHIIPKVSEFAKVVCYDRPGLGWSEYRSIPRNSPRAVEDLRQFLKEAEFPPPYILCGHSSGGQTVRLYASLYPEEVVGLALIDALATDTLPEDSSVGEFPWLWRLVEVGANFGVAEVWIPAVYPRVKGEPELTERRNALKCRTEFFSIGRKEYTGAFDRAGIRGKMRHLGDTPITVVSTPASHLPGDWWVDGQEFLASVSNDVEHIQLPDGHHFLNASQPEVIVEAIQNVVQRVKVAENARLGDG